MKRRKKGGRLSMSDFLPDSFLKLFEGKQTQQHVENGSHFPKSKRKAGYWHTNMQNLFPKTHQEVEFSFLQVSEDDTVTKRRRFADVCQDETVIEYQHSRITRTEVNNRNNDYGVKLGKTVAWVIDCTDNKTEPKRVSSDDDGEEVWMLEFDKKWHVDSMCDCKILFADFGDRMFRVPIDSVRHRIVLVLGSWQNKEDWKSHITSDKLEEDVDIPVQSTLTVAQDPHGSGKTYDLTRMIIHTDLPKYQRYGAYSTFIVVGKPHSVKENTYAEFLIHLQRAGIEYDEHVDNNKYIVKFARPSGDNIMCIFGTADSLMYNLCENKMRGTDVFINLVKTIHKHGPTKLQGPKGRFRYAGQQPRLNKKTLIITDEATMLPESYADAFSTMMLQCHVDVHLAGDVQQSTYFEHNILTRVVGEYNESLDGSLPSFPGCKVIMHPGKEVRRFNQYLVDFRNRVMDKFHAYPSHNLDIPIPIAAPDVSHSRGEYSLHKIDRISAWDDPESEEVANAVENIMDHLRRDVSQSKLLPNDILVVVPFVKNNPLMDELQTSIHEFWIHQFENPEYKESVRHRADYTTTDRHYHELQSSSLPWFCVLHRSEEGKPIDTNESKYSTRIVSIHASQGDGRNFEYLVGLSEKKLMRFTAGKINLKYESLFNVVLSRMKQVIRVFLEPIFDDVWERFKPLMDEEMVKTVPPELKAKTNFKLVDACNLEMDEALFNATKSIVMSACSSDTTDPNRPMVDYAHHMIRMATAHTVFWAHLVVHQAKDKDVREQVFAIFGKVARAEICALPSTTYYRKLRDREATCIPVLYYFTGASSWKACHDETIQILREVQKEVQQWLRGKETDFSNLKPQHAVLLQYAVEVFQLAPFGLENVKMDHIYDVVNCYMQKTDDSDSKLQRHYDYLGQLTSLFHQVIEYSGDEEWSWKIGRSITLGNKRTGSATQYFRFRSQIAHLFVTETRAMPVILCSTVDEMNIAAICAQALLYTLVCIQPEQKVCKDTDKGIPTWHYVKDRQIKVCFVPLKASSPLIVDLTQVVEDNIELISQWICRFVEYETETDILQACKIASHYDDFENAQELVSKAYEHGKCPDYILGAFNEADGDTNIAQLLRQKLESHLKTLHRDIKRR